MKTGELHEKMISFEEKLEEHLHNVLHQRCMTTLDTGHARDVNAAIPETRGRPSDVPPVGTAPGESRASSLPDPINIVLGTPVLAPERPLNCRLPSLSYKLEECASL